MDRKTVTFFCCIFFILFIGSAFAETRDSEFALFKRSISPVYNWGENGLITVPKATPLGTGNIHFGASVQDSGKIEGDNLYLTAASIMIGTSSDVEFGYTKRQFIWDDGDKTDLDMDTYHFKARIFHIADSFIPQVALGINAVSLNDNEFTKEDDILFNPYLCATVNIPLIPEKFVLSATGVVENLYNEGKSSNAFFSAGADLAIFNTVYLLAEVQGLNKDKEDPIYNFGVKLKSGWFSFGVTMFNAIQNEVTADDDLDNEDSTYYMGYASIEIPLGKIFKGKDKK